MPRLTYADAVVNLPVDRCTQRKGGAMRNATLVIGVALMVAVGCDELQRESWDSCVELMQECDDKLVPQLSEWYCKDSTHSWLDEHGNYTDECEAFRRGQMCQCLTTVCVEILDVMPPDPIGEDMDNWLDAVSLQCPGVWAYGE